MGENSAIEWTDHTFNPWWGCTKVSEACRNCYAETHAKRFSPGNWGPTGRRKFFGDKHWSQPLKWNRSAEKAGTRRRVFCASMADVFEGLNCGHPDEQSMERARNRLWELIDGTPWLDWLLLTKRPERIMSVVPIQWRAPWEGGGPTWPDNVWIGTTVEDQATASERLPHLLRIPAVVRFLSCEPLLSPVDLTNLVVGTHGKPDDWGDILRGGCGEPVCLDAVTGHEECSCGKEPLASGGIDWVIAGGESGHGARPMHPGWARALRDQCNAAGVPFLFKQWGAWSPDCAEGARIKDVRYTPNTAFAIGPKETAAMYRIGKKLAGRILDGRTWDGVPVPL